MIRMIVIAILIVLSIDSFAGENDKIIYLMGWSPDEQYIALRYSNRLDIVEADSMEVIFSTSFTSSKWSYYIDWSPSGDKLALIFNDSTVDVLETETWQVLYSLEEYPKDSDYHEGPWVSWSPDGQYFYTKYGGADINRIVMKWDANTGEKLEEYPGFGYLSWQPQGDYVVMTVVDWIDLLDAITLTQIGELELPNDDRNNYQTSGLAWSLDGNYLVLGYTNGAVRIWNLQTQTIETEFVLRMDDAEKIMNFDNSIAYHSSGACLAISTYVYIMSFDLDSPGYRITEWDTSNWEMIAMRELPDDTIITQFSPSGTQLLYLTEDGELHFEPVCTQTEPD